MHNCSFSVIAFPWNCGGTFCTLIGLSRQKDSPNRFVFVQILVSQPSHSWHFLEQILLCCGGHPVHCQTFSSVTGQMQATLSAGGSVVKNLPAMQEALGSIPGSGRSPGGGNGNRFQYSCLENPMNRGAWHAIVHEVAEESDMTG